MKKNNKSGLFTDKNLMKRTSMSSVRGGNKSDALWGGHKDSKMDGSYDVVLNSLLDIEKTSTANDKPIVNNSYTTLVSGF